MAKSKKPNIRRLAREWALQFLYQAELKDEKEDDDHDLFWDQLRSSPSCPKPEQFKFGYDFATELINGVQQNRDEFDGMIQELASNWDFSRITIVDKSIMRIAIYELLKTDIPRAVSINEAVEIAKVFSDTESKNFINGILDKIKKPGEDK